MASYTTTNVLLAMRMSPEGAQEPAVRKGVRRRTVQVVSSIVFQAVVLFLVSGDWLWGWAWMYVFLTLIGLAVLGSPVVLGSPPIVAERAKVGFEKDWDRWLTKIWGLVFVLGCFVVAALEHRVRGGVSPLAFDRHVYGIVLFALGWGLFLRAMLVDRFFTAPERNQRERGHQVCAIGPYGTVRHPGYVGVSLQGIGIPLILGSIWALVAGAVAALRLVARNGLEDRTRQEELEGYREYAPRVRYRLVPGVRRRIALL